MNTEKTVYSLYSCDVEDRMFDSFCTDYQTIYESLTVEEQCFFLPIDELINESHFEVFLNLLGSFERPVIAVRNEYGRLEKQVLADAYTERIENFDVVMNNQIVMNQFSSSVMRSIALAEYESGLDFELDGAPKGLHKTWYSDVIENEMLWQNTPENEKRLKTTSYVITSGDQTLLKRVFEAMCKTTTGVYLSALTEGETAFLKTVCRLYKRDFLQLGAHRPLLYKIPTFHPEGLSDADLVHYYIRLLIMTRALRIAFTEDGIHFTECDFNEVIKLFLEDGVLSWEGEKMDVLHLSPLRTVCTRRKLVEMKIMTDKINNCLFDVATINPNERYGWEFIPTPGEHIREYVESKRSYLKK